MSAESDVRAASGCYCDSGDWSVASGFILSIIVGKRNVRSLGDLAEVMAKQIDLGG